MKNVAFAKRTATFLRKLIADHTALRQILNPIYTVLVLCCDDNDYHLITTKRGGALKFSLYVLTADYSII